MRLMDYDKFKKEYESFDEYMKQSRKDFILDSAYLDNPNVIEFKQKPVDDRVDHPSHYTNGSQEAIVTIEEAIDGAPTIQTGMLQAQVLKYLLRVWYKDNPLEDLKKAQWYLTRLIEKLQWRIGAGKRLLLATFEVDITISQF